MKINNHIVLDFNKTKQVNTQTIQCDMKSRFVRVSLRHNNSPIDLSDVRVCIMAVKPDGKEIFNDCTVIDAQNGIAEFEITKQMGIVVGEVECQIKLFGKEKLLSSNIFNLSVNKSLYPDSQDSKDQLNTLVNTLGEVQDINNRFNKTNYKIDENYQKVNAQLSRVLAKNLRMVSKADSEYTTIMSAVEAGGDTIDNPITIMVAPGMYEEQVYIRQWSRINLVGTNKKDCIVVNHGGGYTDEPLITAGERYIANMTFRATHEKSTVTDKNQWKSYAFHGDKSSGGDGTTLVENCRFESYHSASVGLGVYNNQTFHFKNCEFYSKIEYDSTQANIGAFFAHNNVSGGSTNGKLIFENCSFFMDNDRSGYGHACYINDANLTNGDGSGNPINVQFINCTLLRKVGGFVNALRVDTTTDIQKLSGSINLMYSNGNNISSINTPQIIWNEVQLPDGVTNVGSNFTPLRYCKNNIGEVVVEGTVRGASSSQTTKLFTLPVGFRPKYHRFYDVNDTEGSKIGKILVNRNGDVSVEGNLSLSRIDISFTFLAEQ